MVPPNDMTQQRGYLDGSHPPPAGSVISPKAINQFVKCHNMFYHFTMDEREGEVAPMLQSDIRLASEPAATCLDAVLPEWQVSTENGLQMDFAATASLRSGRLTLRPFLMVTTIRGAAELAR